MKQIKKNKPKCEVLGNMFGRDKGTGFAGNVYSVKGLCPTINTCSGGWRHPLVLETYENGKEYV